MQEEKGEKITVTLLELIKINQIRLKNERINLENMDCVISLFGKTKNINHNTTVEELEEIQTQVRAMLNQTEEKLKEYELDKKFVKEIQDRANNV